MDVAKMTLEKAEQMPVVGILAQKAYDAVAAAEEKLVADAPTIEGEACAECKKIAAVLGGVKDKIESVMDKLDAPKLQSAVKRILNVINDKMMEQCAVPAPAIE